MRAVVDTGAQSTIISQRVLHEVARHMCKQGRQVPVLEQPSVKLYGRSGTNSSELTITAQAELQFSVDGHSVTTPVFIHPESEIPCLLGMNVLPHLGLRFVQADGKILEAKPLTEDASRVSMVCVVSSTYLPSQKVTQKYKLRLLRIGLDAESASKSAFTTHRGLHEFTRMPFGMCNAPATFQRLMEIVLAGMLWESCFAYIDDLLVCSKTFAEHLEHLKQVFARLRKANLRLGSVCS